MRILLIGATSYVASYFVEECLRRGWDMFAFTRDRVRQEILSGADGNRVLTVNLEGAKSLGSVDAIVNFAYPKDAGTMWIHTATRRLIEGMLDTARHLSPRVVIHVSTQSVFGYSFAREPRPVPVLWAVGDSYLETKTLAEWLFLLNSRRVPYVKIVLRLGNVIGPGAYLISELASRILFDKPLGRGVTNATYVRNVADYICRLVSVDPSVLRAFGTFHHLAEFSSYRWPSIVGPLAEAMALQPSYRDAPARSRTGARDILKAAARYSVAMLFPEAVQDQIAHRQERRWSRFLPLVASEDGVDDNPTLHQVLEFKSHTLPGWSPKFDMETTLRETVAWVRGAGYAARS